MTKLSKFGPFFLLIISFILGVLYNYLFFAKSLGISFPIFILAILIGFISLSRIFNQKFDRAILWFILPLFFFSSMVAIRANNLLTFLNVSASIYILLIIARKIIGTNISQMTAGNYLKTIILPINILQDSPKAFDIIANSIEKERASHLIKGILITIPFIIIFTWLFGAADFNFKLALGQIINLDNFIFSETLLRLFIVIFMTFLFSGAYYYILNRRAQSDPIAPISKPQLIEPVILFGSLNLLFFIFIAFQTTYLFGGQNIIASQGFTYAEYAKKGFFELIAVAFISFLISWVHRGLLFGTLEKKYRIGKVMISALIVQVIIILTSSFVRLSLYEQAYGLSEFRFYSHVLIFWLGAALIVLLLSIATDKKEQFFAFYGFISFIITLILINFVNPDAFIARKNIEQFSGASINKLDICYLTRLSEDAIPEAIKLLDTPNQKDKKTVATEIYRYHNDYQSQIPWQSYNLSRNNAATIIQARANGLQANSNNLDNPCDHFKRD